jgi:squalene-hopene/tetraprenyl-beta-curcumene cyclase
MKALLIGVMMLAISSVSFAQANDPQPLIDKGLAYLKTQQKDDGGWQASEKEPPGITALVLRAFVMNGADNAQTPFIKKGYAKLLTFQLETGGIYTDMLANYNTAIAVSALAAANDPAYQPQLDKAIAFLKGLQWTEHLTGPKGETVADKNDLKNGTWYGGWGYGNHSRPDLSNAQFALQALHDAGLKSTDPTYAAALVFLTRTQNNSETNDQSWASNDGGFVYTPANGGASEAGDVTVDGKRFLRSYGSMTYAGLKSMIYAGLTKDDPRVKAAMQWIAQHWTLDENPAMREAGQEKANQGLYYYYYVYAHALRAYGEPVITDAAGAKHDWRAELIAKLASSQQTDGSWTGEKRWMEANPVLATSYAVMALEEAREDLKIQPTK